MIRWKYSILTTYTVKGGIDTTNQPQRIICQWESWLGIPILCYNFWDPHCKQNSASVFDSEDSGQNFSFEIPMSGESEIRNSDSELWNSGNYIVCVVVIEKPHKKTDTYSSVDTKVDG